MPKTKIETLLKAIDGKNTGLIVTAPKITDYVAGLETGIPYEAINPTGKWGKYYPAKETQSNIYTDFLCCTSGSHTRIRATRFNFKLKNKLFPEHAVKFLNERGYLDKTGSINFSERFLAILGKTNINKGAAFADIAEIARTYGLVPESALPIKENMKWEEFYTEIPADVLAMGREFLEVFELLYEWVDMNFALIDDPLGEDTTKALKQSPLQVALGLPGYHALELGEAIIKTKTEKLELFDSYPPFIYTASKSFPIHYSMKLVEIVKAPKPVPEKPNFTFTRTLKMGMSGTDVNALQKILIYTGDFTLQPTEYFGAHTKGALQKWQQRNQLIADGIAGPKTIAKLNTEFSSKKKALE